MRTSTLARWVIVIATVAIGPVALTAAPANAASASGVTRDQVVAAIGSVRATGASLNFDAATTAQLRVVAQGVCAISASENAFFEAQPTAAGQGADGLLVKTYVRGGVGQSGSDRECVFAVLTVNQPALSLTGTLTLSGTAAPPVTASLSRDVFISAAITARGTANVAQASFTSTGNATRTRNVTTTKKVKDKKTKAEKKKAKKTYAKRLKAAKKAYAKALKKAKGDAAKKSAAKRKYVKKKAAVKASYKYAIAGYRLVKKTTRRTERVPFTLSADVGQVR